MTEIKQSKKKTSAKELTPVPTTLIERLGCVSKDNKVDEIIRVVLCM
jgi:hypothetical protein